MNLQREVEIRCFTTKLAANIPAGFLSALILQALPSSELFSKCINLQDEHVLVSVFVQKKKKKKVNQSTVIQGKTSMERLHFAPLPCPLCRYFPL